MSFTQLYRKGEGTKINQSSGNVVVVHAPPIPTLDGSESPLRHELKRIRAENPRLFNAFMTGQFD